MTPGHLRYAFRLARRTPLLAVVVVLTLAAGIAVTTCVFGLVNVAWFQPLPYPDASRLVVVHESHPREGYAPLVSLDAYEGWRARARQVDGLGAYVEDSFAFGRPGQHAERIRGVRVSASLLALIGGRPALGRRLIEADEQPGAAAVALVSQRFWRQRLSADPRAIGASVRLDGVDTAIVGVFPYDFRLFNSGFDVFVPLQSKRAATGSVREATVVARLAPSSTASAAAAEFRTLKPAGDARAAAADGWVAVLRPLDEVLWSTARPAYLLLLAVTALLLLLICANVANLLLARSVSRRQEFAIRLAIGAGRAHLVRQLLTEGLMLALLSGALGFLLCTWLQHLLIASYPEMVDLRIDGRVFAFVAAVSLLVGCGLGFVPAVSILRGDAGTAWPRQAWTVGSRRHRLGPLLAGGQLAVATMLLIACGLLVRGALHMRAIDPGFPVHDVLTAGLSLPPSGYPSAERRAAFLHAVEERLQRLPGVRSAAVASRLPLDGGVESVGIELSGAASPIPGSRLHASRKLVTASYFRTLGVTLLAGSVFRPEETGNVAVVNQALARAAWGGERAAIGRSLRLGEEGWRTVIGVVGDVRQVLPSSASAEMYVPLPAAPPANVSLILKTVAAPAAAAPALRGAIRGLDPDLPLSNVWSMAEIVASYVPAAFLAAFGLLAIASLLLGSMGLYAVMAFGVAGRTREFGIRSALGADARRLRRVVLREGLWLSAGGLLAGAAGSILLGLALSRAFEGLSPFDPVVVAGVAILLGAVSAGACLFPAMRATRVQPASALRSE